MTTMTRPDATSSSPAPDRIPSHRTSRLSRWRASWRVALRMAVRDVRRHRGRSVLVLVMVAVPTGLLVGLSSFAASESASAADRIPLALGTAQALLTGPDPAPVLQGADPDEAMMTGTPESAPRAKTVPGLDVDTSLGGADNVAAISRLTGGDVERLGQLDMRHVMGKRSRAVSMLVLDPSRGLGEKATLVSGRWARTATEVVVTPYGIDRGMPASGTATLTSQGKEYPVTVVGVAHVFNGWGGMPDAVSPQPVATDSLYTWQWLVFRDAPVTYAEVRRLNEYGFRVSSADVLRHPPAVSELPPQLRTVGTSQADQMRVMVAVGAVMLFLVTTLLVAPAFAVSAARQRRTLALAASNGAETRQLRRKVLAQAVVLGALSAVASAAIALALLRIGLLWWVHHEPWTGHRYFKVPVLAVLFIVVCSVVSAMVAAMIPAARLGRLDIVGVMRGQSVSPGLGRVVPAIGLVLAVGGGAALMWAVRAGQRELTIAAAGVTLTLGALMLVPLLLVTAGRMARPLSVAARMATRDAARHRSRSVPTVAAIMAGTIALTMFSIGLASDTEQRQREYQPQAPLGEGLLQYYPDVDPNSADQSPEPSREAVRALLQRVAPHLVGVPLGMAQFSGAGASDGDPVPFLSIVPPGCSPADTLTGAPATPDAAGKVMGETPAPGTLFCNLVGSTGMRQIGILPAADIARAGHLDARQRDVLTAGGILVQDQRLVRDGAVVVATGSLRLDTSGAMKASGPSATRSMPAITGATPFNGLGVGAFVTPDTAQQLGWPVYTQSLLIRSADGPISSLDEHNLAEAVGDEGSAYVERGFQREDRLVMAALFGGFALLLLIVTLISTALSLSEQRADLGTFAAVGATRGTRRRLAAAQAMVVGLIGALVGIAVGLVPGVALTYPLTGVVWDQATGVERHVDPTIVIPWLPLSLVVLGVPVLAGLLSAAAVRTAPVMTRRRD